jgi:hypothetical protein
MARGFVTLAAVVDWFSRKVLAWRLSITLSADCLASKLSRRRSPATGGRTSSTRTKAVSSPAPSSSRCSRRLRSPSAWTARAPRPRQRLRRAPLANGEVRGGLSAGLRQRLRGASLDRALSRLHQRQATSFIPRRADARPALSQPADANPGGGVTQAGIHLATARKLFRQTERPHSLVERDGAPV